MNAATHVREDFGMQVVAEGSIGTESICDEKRLKNIAKLREKLRKINEAILVLQEEIASQKETRKLYEGSLYLALKEEANEKNMPMLEMMIAATVEQQA